MIDYPKGMPCWAPGAAIFLDTLLSKDMVAREWGGGQSTVWLAERVKFVSVIEDSLKWASWIEQRTVRDTVQVLVRDPYVPDYTQCGPDFNLYLIDGYNRIDCMEKVQQIALRGDIVVCDDALDYAEHMLPLMGEGEIHRFAQPHPHAGIPINHKKYGHLRNTVRKVHADTKETWIWQV